MRCRSEDRRSRSAVPSGGRGAATVVLVGSGAPEAGADTSGGVWGDSQPGEISASIYARGAWEVSESRCRSGHRARRGIVE